MGVHIRSVRLEDICDTSNEQASDKAVVPNVLPAFFHIFLARLDTEQISGGRIVRIAMASAATEGASGRESLSPLWPPSENSGAEAIRQRTSGHCAI